ncbi:gliding motility-associated-like protein [Arcicella sp. BE140]|uniref:T9SS type B sorting domain-containing protein n=1 Tax=Arcicella sp. BE140 TaxID=2817847 RepID=UPI00285E19DF|nr:gliding motility-associated C-terminal domain-containing protein [Arcicella sp. BE140]MDR6564120.1 gliding motility-associated-like protein [Arcicella sp. BE51]MDR6813873.1 gliding motility-associated-like protein [Arcicella sp. BE140]MDR6825185.1 gliding motility-associated-like protein [Arcicella sp. BE139]
MFRISSIQRFFLLITCVFITWVCTNTASAQFSATKTCLSECSDSTAATIFKDLGTTVATAWRWDFGDPTSTLKNVSTLQNPAHLYSTPGPKLVTLIRTENGVPVTYTKTITINAPPQAFFLGQTPSQQDTTICKGSTILLDPYRNGGAQPQYKYRWFPKGDSTQTLIADTTSCYSVQVTDTITGCSAQNKINVQLCVPPPPKPPETSWFFGNNAGIKFSNGSATPDTEGKLNTVEGVSSIADQNGNLLFYTDGRKVYDKDGNEMAAINPADTLKGSSYSTQSAVIVPQPSCQGCQSYYYIFTTTEINGEKKLTYSIVDIRLNQGKGKIIQKNLPLDDVSSTENLISTFVKKDSTYWVISHDYNTNTYRMYRVTKNGISISKTINIGSKIDSVEKAQGYLKVSQDATKLAIAIPGGARNLVEVYDFADSTGAITNKRIIDLGPAPPTVYGVEFSPNSKTLFVTMKADTIKKPDSYSSLLRYDLTQGDSVSLAKSKITLDSSKKEYYGSVQLGPDGKIYLAVQGTDTLGVIKLPNDTVSYTNANKIKIDTSYYQRDAFSLSGKTSQLGLPTTATVVITKNSGVGIMASDTCFGSPSNFQTNHLCEGETFKNTKTDWRFYAGPAPQAGNDGKYTPVGSPVYTVNGGAGDAGLKVSYTFLAPGKYHVFVNMGNQCLADTLLPPQEFEIFAIPTADLGNDINLCQNTTTLTAANNLPDSHYAWLIDGTFSPKDTLRTLVATKSGKYTVLVEKNGCIAEDSVNVNLYAAKPFYLGADTTICQNTSFVLSASNAGTSTTTTFLWNTGQTTPSIVVSSAGTYAVTVKESTTNCEVKDQITVRTLPKPSFIVNRKLPSSCNIKDGQIDIQNLSPADTYTFVWYKDGIAIAGQTQSSLKGIEAGSYRVSIQSTISCDTTFNITLLALGSNPNIIVRPTDTYCDVLNSGSIAFTVNTNSGVQPTTYDLKLNGNPDASVRSGSVGSILVSSRNYLISGLGAGTYTLELSDPSGCKYIESNLVIAIRPRTVTSITVPPLVCQGDTIVLKATNASTGTISWSTGENTPEIKVSRAGQYTVTVMDATGKCISTAKSLVSFKPVPVINPSVPNEVCENSRPIQLLASPAAGVWKGANVTPGGLYTPSPYPKTDIVSYEVTGTNGCVGSSTSMIKIAQSPKVDLGADRDVCRNGIDFIGTNLESGVTYRWNTGQTTNFIYPTQQGLYTLNANLGNCRASDDIIVRLLPSPFIPLKSELPLCVPDALPIKLDAGGGAGQTYRWFPTGQTDQSIFVSNVGIYTVEVTNTLGCTSRASTNVVDRCEPSILVPDIFTPNGDIQNDSFQVFTAHIKDFELKIFNRWGELLFISKRPEDRWDGKYKGVLVKPDSFVWQITYTAEYFPERGTLKKQGAVTVAW